MSSKRLTKTEKKLKALQKMTKVEAEVEKRELSQHRSEDKKEAMLYKPNKVAVEIGNMQRKIQITNCMLADIDRMHAEHAKYRALPASKGTQMQTEQMLWDLQQMRGDMLLLERPSYVVPADGGAVVGGAVDVNSASATVTGYLNQAQAGLNSLQTLNSQVLQGVHDVQSVLSQNKKAVDQITLAVTSATLGIVGVLQEMKRSA
jgi:hypothetical protein